MEAAPPARADEVMDAGALIAAIQQNSNGPTISRKLRELLVELSSSFQSAPPP